MEPTIALLESVWQSLGDLGAGMAADDWERPTDCPGWKVRDQYAHMIGTESMLAGRPSPEVEVPDLEHLRNDIGKFNEAWTISLADLSGAELLERFRGITAERLEALRALPPEKWDEEGFTPEGPGPYRQFMEIRVFDCWFHEQDVREALGRPGDLEGPVADHALERTKRALGFVVGKKAAAPQGSTVVFEVTGEPLIEVAVGVDGRAALLEEIPADPTTRLTTDRRVYSRLVGGRRPGLWALNDGLVSIAGDEKLGQAVVENMAFTI